ncbi:MCE family protein [Candidatus Acetothermia bacterium]|nr:MCE family protein [Candidatus Acetothermia bacterium]
MKSGSLVKVSILVVVALGILFYMLVKLGAFAWLSQSTREFTVRFDSVSGLSPGARVLIAGVEVGKVKEIALEGGRAKLVLSLESPAQLHEDAVALLRTQGLLGERYVEIQPGQGAALAPNQEIPKSRLLLDLDRFLDQVGSLTMSVRQFSDSFNQFFVGNEGQARLERLVEDLDALGKLVKEFSESKGTLKKLIEEPVAYEKLNKALDSATQFVERFEKMSLVLSYRMNFLLVRPSGESGFRNTLSVRMQMRPERSYLAELIELPKQSWKASLQVAWNFGILSLHGGLIESTIGAGAELKLGERLRVSIEAFDFTRLPGPHMRLQAGFDLVALFIAAGYDDLLLPQKPGSIYFSVGVRLTDEDLRYLLGLLAIRL